MAKRKKSTQSKQLGDSPATIGSSKHREHHSMSVRQINNGYIVSEHGHHGDDKYYDRETYHAKKPKVQLTGSVKSMERKIGDKKI